LAAFADGEAAENAEVGVYIPYRSFEYHPLFDSEQVLFRKFQESKNEKQVVREEMNQEVSKHASTHFPLP
jgi:hypothetical protein